MNERIERFQKLVEQYPENEMARFSLGKALFDHQQFAAAKEHLSLALAKKPDWIIALLILGKCEMALGHSGPARVALEQARHLVVGSKDEGPLAEIDHALAELAAQ